MNKLAKTLNDLKAVNRKGLIVYITAGYPDYATSLEAVVAAAEAGADIIEIGLPFSDPMADGPIIQKAATAALAAGATTAKTLELAAQISKRIDTPLAVMTYLNTVMQYGTAKFAREFAAAGISGLIVPDLPIEESGLVEPSCAESGLNLIQFVAPTSTGERIAAICAKAEGFLYCISSTGVTGVREIDYSSLQPIISEVRRQTATPVAIGFGIGSPQAAKTAAQFGDAVIVGSAVMERLMQDGVAAMREFVATMRQALDDRG